MRVVHAAPVHQVLLPLAVVRIQVGKRVDPAPVPLVPAPFALVRAAVGVHCLALALPVPHLPLAAVLLSVRVRQRPFPMPVVVHPVSLIDGAVGVVIHALAITAVSEELTLILGTVGEHHFSGAALDPLVPEPNIPASACVDHISVALLQVVSPRASVPVSIRVCFASLPTPLAILPTPRVNDPVGMPVNPMAMALVFGVTTVLIQISVRKGIRALPLFLIHNPLSIVILCHRK
mmetsp:Transcript_11602/g.27340  ORF Transcript_11602/g.27340 Transcript_11602/m.27340 type:complete len:234 (+) Transcript_11602:465-1166(+)